ncbi:hypothetical protein SCOCK_210058 [Actinacidiphila cocklensis]|uniref:DUF4158 domain-containing protein n=1 Tax=Actinacidiphila cocklensis TaxID=887465 RepID=A0A9W4GRD8_9ACTN|nr:hypothetical protein SCOCK_210058 [Actinacidiphila cocklensis]
MPAEVAEYLAEQLEIEDVSCLKLYGERDGTARRHAGEIQEAGGWRDFAEVREELVVWLDARAWTTGDGPKALFDAAAGWLREGRVLLPGASRLARLVASVREAANQRLWDSLYGMLSTGQRAVLDSLLTVPPGERVSELDRLRRGPVRVSGPQMKRALERAEEITAFGMGAVDVSRIPPRRLAELSRYGVDGKASLLRRHGDPRRLATLLATTVYLTTRAVDDALDLLEVLIATKLLAKAERETVKEKMKTLPRVERASAKLATAFQIVFDTTSELVDTDTGEVTGPAVESFEAMWERIEAVVPRHELAAAIAALFELTPPLDSDADEAWRSMLVSRFGTVRPFLKLLVAVVDFGAPRGRGRAGRAQVAAGSHGPQEGRPGRDRHRAAGRVVAAPGPRGAAPGAGHGGLEGVHVLHAGAAAPDAAKQSRRTPRSGVTRGRSCWPVRRGSRPGRPCWPRSDCPARWAGTWRRGRCCWTARTGRSPDGCRTTRRSSSTTTAVRTSRPWSRSPNRPPCWSCGSRPTGPRTPP